MLRGCVLASPLQKMTSLFLPLPLPPQKRTLLLDRAALASMGDTTSAPSAAHGTGALGPAQQALVRAADTFFIASCSGAPPPAAAAAVPALSDSAACGGSGGGTKPSGTAAAAAAAASVTTSAATSSAAAAYNEGHLPADPSAYGCDMSHRGGMPGFIQVGAVA